MRPALVYGRFDVSFTPLERGLFTINYDNIHIVTQRHTKKIAVIGAGLSGICSAYFLAQAGYEVAKKDFEVKQAAADAINV